MENPSKVIFKNLLDDDVFIQWFSCPTPELDIYWKKRMDEQEDLENEIRTLKDILENLRIKEPELSAEDRDKIWQKIESQIDNSPQKRNYRKIILWGSSIAASAIIFITGLWLLKSGDTTQVTNYAQYALDDDLLKSGNINLILSENKRIDIEKDSATIKYDSQGGININSEKVEKDIIEDATPQLNQLIVPYGKTTSLVLSDGSKIWINSGSRIIYPAVFDKNRREIFLTGEAFLDVAKNENVPFIVKTNDIELNVLGTEFNVSAYNDDHIQSVVLVSGSVGVKSHNLKRGYKIEPNQMFSYSKTSNDVNIQQVDVSYYTSWMHGYMLLQSEKLDIVLHKLARHFNVDFSFDKDEFERTSLTGKLDLNLSLKDVLDNISVTAPLKYDIQETNVLIELE